MTIQEIIIAAYRAASHEQSEELIVGDYIRWRWRNRWALDTTDPNAFCSPSTAEAAGMLAISAEELASIYSDAPNQHPDGGSQHDAETWVDPTIERMLLAELEP